MVAQPRSQFSNCSERLSLSGSKDFLYASPALQIMNRHSLIQLAELMHKHPLQASHPLRGAVLNCTDTRGGSLFARSPRANFLAHLSACGTPAH